MSEPIVHPLEPIFDVNSRVLILGTMPSPASRAREFYYAHPQNRFWPTLAAILGVPAVSDPAARRRLALTHGIALWDVLHRCTIDGASDRSIRNPEPNDIASLLAAAPIRAVFTTGQTAARLYQSLCFPTTGIFATTLPSPSPANCACSRERLLDAYRAILPWLAP